MKVLMLGWEFPPNISGGLGTACYGITQGLSVWDDVEITFVVPKVHGNEMQSRIKLRGANQIDLIKNKILSEESFLPLQYYSIESSLSPYLSCDEFGEVDSLVDNSCRKNPIEESHPSQNQLFSGKYGPGLMSEIKNYALVGEYLATTSEFDLIHAHDWLTFPAGIAAKKKIGKPLIVHVHATDFDRSGGDVNPKVFQIEKEGMAEADCVICVSNRTRELVIDKYGIAPKKICAVHNGVIEAVPREWSVPKGLLMDKIVTFMGRLTKQKGPEYFLQVAELVLREMKQVRFVVAGSGELFHQLVRDVAKAGLADRFLFTGFLSGDDVTRLFKRTDVFVMPSVSEPFGICPLEAMQMGVPVIISKQSGVSEIVKHAIKVDFWDVHAMADAIHGIFAYQSLAGVMKENGRKEACSIKWEQTARKIHDIYCQLFQVA